MGPLIFQGGAIMFFGKRLAALIIIIGIAGFVLAVVIIEWRRRANRPDEYELAQKVRLLGVDVKTFPEPQGLAGFDEVQYGDDFFTTKTTERPPSGPDPPYSYESQPTRRATHPNGTVYQAYCGHSDDPIIADLNEIGTTERWMRRHIHPNNDYYWPSDVLIGPLTNTRLHPILVFRDVGSHHSAPHSFAIDGSGKCHLMVSDVFMGENNRHKLYWVIGDVEKKAWEDATLIECERSFTGSARPDSVRLGDSVHLIWSWHPLSGPGRLCYLEWTPRGFGRKMIVTWQLGHYSAIAVDPQHGLILLAYSTTGGVFFSLRTEDKSWTRPKLLHEDINADFRFNVAGIGKRIFAFRVRQAGPKIGREEERTREFHVEILPKDIGVR
jgi:hypothetical protein